MSNQINSNITGVSYAEETSIGVVDPATVWYDEEPNSEDAFGGTYATISRTPIEPGRQNKKGTVTDLDVEAGYNVDFTQSNLNRLLQGFLFADAREMPTTKPLNSAQVSITGADDTDDSFNAAAGLNVFAANDLVFVRGFTNGANNGLHLVESAAAAKLEVAGSLITETGTSAVSIEKVGTQFASGDAALTVSGDLVSLELTAGVFTGMPGIMLGGWVYIGGDSPTTSFAAVTGYARIGSMTSKKLTFDQMSNTVVADAGTGKTIQMFSGTIIRNEQNPDLIKLRTYQYERSLGKSENSLGVQAEYCGGCGANEFTMNVGTADKVNVDVAFVGTKYEVRSGEPDDLRKTGTHVPAKDQPAFNTSSNIPLLSVHVFNAARSKQVEMYDYCETVTMGINNNITGDKAIGVLGSFDLSYGNMDVTYSTTGYFGNVQAQKAIANNADVGATAIIADKNAGMVWDIPLGTLGGGQLSVELGAKVKSEVELMGAKNRHGYTVQYQTFAYLPDSAMGTTRA